jgi:RimJ/RimL family protein N-acetyltransferase
MLGDVGLYVDPPQQEAEVGFALSRAAQGVGHATRAFD